MYITVAEYQSAFIWIERRALNVVDISVIVVCEGRWPDNHLVSRVWKIRNACLVLVSLEWPFTLL